MSGRHKHGIGTIITGVIVFALIFALSITAVPGDFNTILPDILIEDISLNRVDTENATISAAIGIVNGSANNIKINFLINNRLLDYRYINLSLNSGQTLQFTWDVEDNSTYKIKIVADQNNEIIESDEGNNIGEASLSVRINTECNFMDYDFTYNFNGQTRMSTCINIQSPFLRIYKTASKDTASEDDVVTYTLFASNLGTAPAYDVLINDTLPYGFEYVNGSMQFSGINNSQFSYFSLANQNRTLNWGIEYLSNKTTYGNNITVKYNVTVKNASNGIKVNTAEVNGYYCQWPENDCPQYEPGENDIKTGQGEIVTGAEKYLTDKSFVLVLPTFKSLVNSTNTQLETGLNLTLNFSLNNESSKIVTVTEHQSLFYTPENLESIGYYDIVSDLTNGNFNVTLTFDYTDSELNGIDENTMDIYYWDNGWKALNATANTVANTLTVTVNHFTVFSIMGSSTGINDNINAACTNNSLCAGNQFCNSSGFCQNLSCSPGYTPEEHICNPVVGCKIGAKIGAKVGGKVGAKNTNYSNVMEISGCAGLNVSNSIYFLTQDIAFSGDTCINVTAENVSLDCRWNRINGNGSYGIFVNAKNVFIENCIVENWDTGIHLDLGNNTAYCNLIENNSRGITSNAQNELYKNLVRNNTYGVLGDFKNLTANEIIKNKYGVSGIENITLENNVICRNEIDVNSTNFTYNNNCSSDFDAAVTSVGLPLIADGWFNVSGVIENLFNLTNINVTLFANNEILDARSIYQEIYNFSTGLNLQDGVYFMTLSTKTNESEANELNNELSNAVVVAKQNRSLISGYLTDAENNTIINAAVKLINCSNNQVLKTILSDESGIYSFIVAEGNYSTQFAKDGYSPLNYTCEYVYNSTVHQDHDFIITPRVISGNVTYNSVPVSNASVYLRNCENGESFAAATDSFGNFSFYAVPEGNYTITAYKEGYAYGQSGCFNDTPRFSFNLSPCQHSSFMLNADNYLPYDSPADEIKKSKILNAINYFIYKRNLASPAGAKIGAKVGAEMDAVIINGSACKSYLNKNLNSTHSTINTTLNLMLNFSAADENYQVSVEEHFTEPANSTGFFAVGRYYNITSNLTNGEFNVTLTFSYNHSELNGINENTLDIYYLNGSTWTALNAALDTENNTLTVTVNHFTVFSIMSSSGECYNVTTDVLYVNNDTILCTGVYNNASIIINSSNVVLDCNGSTLNGTGSGYGIYLENKSNVTIKNCNLINYENGIYLSYSSNNTLTSNTASNNYYGIYLWYSSNNNLTSNTANSNTFGIYLEYSSNNTIANNTANSNSRGIYLYESSNNTITNNTANNNTYHGIDLYYSSNNSVTHNTANSNWDGVSLESSANNTLTSNTMSSNYNTGIRLGYFSNNNQLTNNTADNSIWGIYLDYSLNNSIISNTANLNEYQGIYLRSSSDNAIANNTLNSNEQSGIYIFDNSSFNNISNNKISDSAKGITITDCSSPWGWCSEGNINNTLQENKISNNKVGIYSQNSNSTLNSNIVCGNSILDFNSSVWLSSSGDNNTCDKPDGWNDTGATGCTYECPCKDDMYINKNTILGPCSYDVYDIGGDGVLIINSSNIVLDCNGSVLKGYGSGYGVYNKGFGNVTIKGYVPYKSRPLVFLVNYQLNFED